MCIKRRILNEYVVLDIETSGFNPEKDQIIEEAVCKVKDGNNVDEYTTFINPKQPKHQAITEITGITKDMLKKAEIVDIVLPKLLKFIEQLPIVVHNSNFVMEFIRKKCTNLNLRLDNQVIDTLPLCKKKLPPLDIYTITTILGFLQDINTLGDNEIVLDTLLDYTRMIFKVFEMVR